ncbi:unnamed protein product [Dovyalis caffra]|uniref:Uncharacterized protein n=1 Tax=Dovyalis caffra TaxID=77055 RepID=A0AAV1RIM2_9ROSI|nr:unnamed protein product [Dovyalis caffra]
MYVTRPLSLYRNFPSALSREPPEGPYTGYLVITDEEAEAKQTYCWGMCKSRRVKKLPFPQDKILSIVHSSDHEETIVKKVWFIPVLDQPLSSNCYYAIKAKGSRKGQACTCSREMDMGLWCFKSVINDIKPKPLDYRNIYQQFKIHRHHGKSFFSKSLAPDGFPPKFLRKKGWEVRSSRSHKCGLREALGLDVSLRSQLPSFDFPMSTKSSSRVMVGKWYCPFVFVREEPRIRKQMRSTMLYSMTLEQYWKEIYSCENVSNGVGNVVDVNVNVQREMDFVFGMEAMRDGRVSHGGIIWYKVVNGNSTSGRGFKVGLSVATVEKMKWVQEAGGWIDGADRNERVERVVEITSENGWRKFGCYVLVESFVLRRMDGSLVLICDFRHTHKIKCKWE